MGTGMDTGIITEVRAVLDLVHWGLSIYEGIVRSRNARC
jgi:hypothetical protein